MLTSRLFHNDDVLEAVAADRDRISRTRNRRASAVSKIQQVVLQWDPGALPAFGPDGVYGDETASAVLRFKVEELGVPADTAIDDVGPQTVLALDRMRATHELSVDTAASIVQLDAWLNVPLAGFTSAVSTCTVHAHDSGESAFEEFRHAVDSCAGNQAFVVIAGWDFVPQTPVDSGVTIADVLAAAAGRGVRVLGLLTGSSRVTVAGGFEFPIPGAGADNSQAVAFISALPSGGAVLDRWVLHRRLLPSALGVIVDPIQVGSHHQKIWAVFDGVNVRTFVGGVDFNPNRTSLSGTPPWHDVQLELRGQVAIDAYDVVRVRWNDHPERPIGVELPLVPPAPVGGNQRARVLTTFGDPRAFEGVGGPPYPWAPAGSRAVREFLRHAINVTNRFVYIEDQYLVDPSIGADLAARVPRLDGVVIVIPPDNAVNAELHQAARRRAAVLAPLAPHMDKVAVVCASRFVHAKLWIFDDLVAVVGSANSNRRGYSHDSEADVVFGDIVGPGAVSSLRQRLWSRHLGPAAPVANADPLASIGVWKSGSFASGANVDPYGPMSDPDPNPLAVLMSEEEFWDRVVDPQSP